MNSPVFTPQLVLKHLDNLASHTQVLTPSTPGDLTAFTYWRIYPFISLCSCTVNKHRYTFSLFPLSVLCMW
ncbi:hypothetical protein AMECASPLE_005806, partial [Ameca splendens]